MIMPFESGPKVSTLVPSGRMLMFETLIQAPTRSRAVCADALSMEAVIPDKESSVKADVAIMPNRFMVLSPVLVEVSFGRPPTWRADTPPLFSDQHHLHRST